MGDLGAAVARSAKKTRQDPGHGSGLCLLPARARPQVQSFRIPGGGSRSPDGRREVVDSRIGLRRPGVVADEFVLQSPGPPPGEGTRQLGPREVRIRQGVLVQLAGAALVRAQKGGAQLCCRSSGAQHGVEPGRVHHAAGGHEREVDGGPDLREQLRRRAALPGRVTQ